MKKFLWILILFFILFNIKAFAQTKSRGFNSTTELKAFSCLTLSDGDISFVVDSTNISVNYYYYDSSDSTTAESDPDYFIPDDRAANCSSIGIHVRMPLAIEDGGTITGNVSYNDDSGDSPITEWRNEAEQYVELFIDSVGDTYFQSSDGDFVIKSSATSPIWHFGEDDLGIDVYIHDGNQLRFYDVSDTQFGYINELTGYGLVIHETSDNIYLQASAVADKSIYLHTLNSGLTREIFFDGANNQFNIGVQAGVNETRLVVHGISYFDHNAYIKGATGEGTILGFYDRDATANDINFQIYINATDVGDGTEDVDWSLGSQVAGTTVYPVSFDASADVLYFNATDVIMSENLHATALLLDAVPNPSFGFYDSDSTATDDLVARIYAQQGTDTDTGHLWLAVDIDDVETNFIELDGEDNNIELLKPVNVTGALTADTVTLTESFAMINPADDDNPLVKKFKGAATITNLDCVALGGGDIDVDIQECDANGANCLTTGATLTNVTVTNQNDASFTNASIDANDYIIMVLTNKASTVNQLTCTLQWTQAL